MVRCSRSPSNIIALMIRLPGYTLLDEIRSTRDWVLARGRRDSDQQPVLVKMSRPEGASARAVSRLENDYQIRRQVDHESVALAYALVPYSGGLALVLEDTGARLLSTVMASEQIELRPALVLALELTRALGGLHQQGILHTGVRPDSVLVDADLRRIKILDFDTAAIAPRVSAPAWTLDDLEGKLPYMSPEQTGRMNRSTDYRSDFYSLGVTLYELLTGELPFHSADALGLVHAHLAKRPVFPSRVATRIPKMVTGIVLKLMGKAAEERYQSAQGLEWDLEECLRSTLR